MDGSEDGSRGFFDHLLKRRTMLNPSDRTFWHEIGQPIGDRPKPTLQRPAWLGAVEPAQHTAPDIPGLRLTPLAAALAALYQIWVTPHG